MYRLENDVAWTTNLKNAFKHNITRAKILLDGSEINEQNNLADLTLDEQRYISNLGFIGSATARKLELNLIDLDGNINLENKELTLKIGADYKGYNLIDFSTGWTANSNTSYRLSNNHLIVTNSTYSNSSYIEKDITDLIKSNAGEKLKFSFNSTGGSFINYHGTVIVSLIITDVDEQVSNKTMVNTYGSGFRNYTYTIPDDTSDINEVKIRIYANQSNLHESYSEVVISKPMLQFGTEEKEYEPHYSEDTLYINYGNFIVDKQPEVDETNGRVRVVAYDYMIKFNKPYISGVTYPCTLLAVLQDVCSQAGVELGSQDFANKTFMVQDNQFEGATLREVLQNIAKCAFSWARIGQDNKLYLDFSLTADGTETITIDEYKTNSFKKANEYYGPINQITYADSTFDGQESRVKDQQSIDTNGLKELVIYDNMFAYTPENRDALIQAGSSFLGLIYMPISQLELIGLVYLDSRDIIEIGTLDQSTYYSRVFNHSIKYNGAVSDSIVTEGTSSNEEAYKNTAADNFQNQQTRFVLDKANKKIQMIVEKLVDIKEISAGAGSSTGEVSFTDINQSEPIYVQIKPLGENITYLYPRNNLFPANNLYITLRRLRFTNISTNETFDYDLPDDLLYYDSENFDEFILDYNSHKITINKKCEYDSNGNVVLLSQPRTDEYEFPEINLTDGDYNVDVLKYDNTPYICYLYCRLMVQNIYTKQFTTKIETKTQIEQSEESISLSVDQKLEKYPTADEMNSAINLRANSIESVVRTKVGQKEIISSINQSPENIEINASKVSLAGKNLDLTTDNISISSDNFNVDSEGNVTCSNINATDGTFTGDLYMAADKKLASTSQGIMSTLFAEGTGPINGYEYLGYGLSMESKYQRTSPMVEIYIPNNFTPVYAYLFIEQVRPTFKLTNGDVTGQAGATKVRKGSAGPSIELYGFASEYFMNMNALSGTDITQAAFNSSTKVPNVGMTISNNIANKLTKGALNVFSAYITDSTYDNVQATFDGSEQAAIGAITGLAKLSIQVIGYLNPF